MSWAKRNIYFLVSCILAVGLLGAAGWFCYSEFDQNGKNWEELNKAYQELAQIANSPISAGDDKIDNIKTAREQTREAQNRAVAMRKLFTTVPGIPNTNRVDDRALAFAVRDTIRQLRVAAAAYNVALPLDFTFSFSAQRDKAVYAARSGEQLAKQLGEVKTICDVLFASRVLSLEALQRERTADDAVASQLEYLDIVSVTNANNNTVSSPYQVVFRCFSPELAGVIAGFANQSYGTVVKTLIVEPADVALTTDAAGMGASTTPAPLRPGALPVVVDEKKLRVTMLVEFVKLTPTPGK